ncbi:MAG: hypothetical protein GXY52_08975 [Chloroflexi bacterium]|nr:hypothetical protein [Chloroflexota bacterium]
MANIMNPVKGLLTRLFNSRNLAANAFSRHSLITWSEGSVQACIARFNNGSAELLGVANSLVNGLETSGNPDMDRWGFGCEQALHQAEEMTHAEGGTRVVSDHLALGIPCDLVQAMPLVVTRNRRGQNDPIGRMEIQALLDRGYCEASDSLDIQNSRLQIVHSTIGQFRLDGQVVANPLGLHGSELEASLYFSLLPLEWLRASQRLAQQLLVQVSLLVPEEVALANYISDESAWLVILDYHYTLIGLVAGGQLYWSSKIPIGEREIIADAGRMMAMQGREVDVLMRTYREGRLSEEAENRLARALWYHLRRWMSTLAQEAADVLANLPEQPERMYWIDQSGNLSEAQDALRTQLWAQLMGGDSAPEIVELETTRVSEIMDCTAQTNSPVYTLTRATALTVARITSNTDKWDWRLLQSVRKLG